MGKEEKKEETRSPARRSWEIEPWSVFGEGFLSGRMGRMMEDAFRDWPARGERAFVPAIDVAEGEGEYTITAEIPGARKEDVHVELHEGVLTIRGEKKSEREEKKERSRYVERSYGAFSRAFTLPRDADADRLEAGFKDGVLTVTVPRTEAAKPRQIAVKSS
jgi:HSP20 family protein